MSVTAEVETLLILQEKDLKIRRIEKELAQVPLEIQALEAKIASEGATVESLKGKLKEQEVERNKLELDIKSKEESIAKFKTQQQQTRKNEEYSALTHEIERYQSDISNVETTELELMEEMDSTKAQLAKAEEQFQEDKGHIDTDIGVLKKKAEALEQQRGELAAQRDEVTGKLDEDVLSIYSRLLKSKGDAVVVAIENDICTGCHMKLTTQTILKARSRQGLVHCENCSRILYDGR